LIRLELDYSCRGFDAMSVPASPGRRVAGVALAALLSGCRDPTLRDQPSPPPYLLVEKGPYQSLYGPDGKIERLVYDRNGDRIADAVILYGPDGKVQLAEIDTDLDQVIDRWEYFEGGVLVRVGSTRSTRGAPDSWDVVAPDGALMRREYDDDADGKVDRSEPLR
jgi:hypothetical protein